MRRLLMLFVLLFAPAAHAAPPQSLAVTVSEDGGNVFRRFSVGPDGRLTPSTRFRLANPSEGYTSFVAFDPTGRYVHIARYQVLSQYRTLADGSLSPLMVPTIAVGPEPSRLVFAPDGIHAYAVCRDGLWQFRRQPDGTLVSLAQPVAATGTPTQTHTLRKDITKPGEKYTTFEIESGETLSSLSVVFSKNGRQAYVLNREFYYHGAERVIPNWAVQGGGTDVDVAHTIQPFLVGQDGRLSSAAASPVVVDLGASSLLLDPNSRALYVQDARAKTISLCRVNSDGSLSPPVKSSVQGNAQAVTPSGQFSYVAFNDTIQSCAVGDDGLLMPLSAAVPVLNAAENVERNYSAIDSLQTDSTGRFLFVYYASGVSDHSIAMYPIQADGHLAGRPQSVVPIGSQLGGIMALLPALERGTINPPPAKTKPATKTKPAAASHSHRPEFAYLLNADDSSISQFAVTHEGNLAPLSPPKVKIEGGLFPQEMSHIAADPSGRHFYMTNAREDSILQFAIAGDGTLTPMPTTARFLSHPHPTYPVEIVIDPSGRFAFVSTYYSSTIDTFVIGPDGALAAAPSYTLSFNGDGAGSLALFLDAAANLLLVRHANNQVESCRIGQDGSLVSVSHFQPNLGQPLAFDPFGKFAFYGDGSGAVWQFLLSPEGVMSENTPRSVPADQSPQRVAIHPTGRFAYSANGGDFYGDGSISQYRLASDGRLSPLSPPSVMTGTSPDVLVMDASGQFLYTFNTHRHFPLAPAHTNTPDKLNEFHINTDGTLTTIGTIEMGQEPLAMVIVQPRTSP